MADPIVELEKNPASYGFFQAVRWIEAQNPENPPFGKSKRAGDDLVRFCQWPSLTFAPSTIHDFDRSGKMHPLAEPGAAPRLYQRFQGLLGPNGPLPHILTEYAEERIRHHRDYTLAAFLDIFHHRFISLFYRAWAVNNQAVSFEKAEHDRFGQYVSSLAGYGLPSMKRRDAVSVLGLAGTDDPSRRHDLAKQYFAGHLGAQTRHAEGLQSILNEFYGMPVQIDEFVGQWLEIPKDEQCRLGSSLLTGLIGVNAIAGSRVWDTQSKFRVVFGPLSLREFRTMLPRTTAQSDDWKRVDGDTCSFDRLVAWVKNYRGDEYAWEVQFILKKEEVPESVLGDENARLGMATWLKSTPFVEHADDLVMQPVD